MCKGGICRNVRGDQSGGDGIFLLIDTQELKHGYRMGFVTPVVHALTYVY